MAMRMVECISDLDGEAQDRIERQRTSREALRQRLSLDVLHHDELNSVLFTDIVEGTDVRMVHLGDGPGLALEPLDGLGILQPVRLQDLDSHSPVEARVGRAIDLAHASGAEPRNNRVRTELDACPHSPRFSDRVTLPNSLLLYTLAKGKAAA